MNSTALKIYLVDSMTGRRFRVFPAEVTVHALVTARAAVTTDRPRSMKLIITYDLCVKFSHYVEFITHGLEKFPIKSELFRFNWKLLPIIGP